MGSGYVIVTFKMFDGDFIFSLFVLNSISLHSI